MDRLPPELLILIGKELGEIDRLSFRRVCKKIHCLMTPIIFSKVEVSYTPTSFQNLLNICMSTSLNTHITSVEYYGRVHEEVDRSVWEKYIRIPADAEKSPHPEIPDTDVTAQKLEAYEREVAAWVKSSKPLNYYSTAELDAGFTAYNNAIEESKSFESTHSDFTSFIMSLRNLKNLRTICISTNNGTEWYSNKLARRASLIHDSALLGLPLEESVKFGTRQITSALIAIFAAYVKLKRLEIHRIYWSVLEKQFPLGLEIGAFVRLQTLSLDVSDYSDDFISTAIDHKKREGLLVRAIQSAKKLKNLSLHFDRYDLGEEKRLNCRKILWSELCTDIIWPNLEEILLSYLDLEVPAFLDFLIRHPKLRSLNLESPYLVGSASWVRTFHQMKSVVTLTSLVLYGKFVCEGQVLSEEETKLEEFNDKVDDPTLDMKAGLGQLKGRTDSEGVLRDHITDWFVNNGPSPFLKEFATG